MDRHERRGGLHRVVQVRSFTGSSGGSGYAIGSNLVLTASHILDEDRHWAWVYLPDRREEVRCAVVLVAADVALLVVSVEAGAPWPDVDVMSQRFGRPTGDRALRCVVAGFPRFQQRSDGRSVEVVPGSIMAGTHYGSGLLAFDIQGAAPVSPDAWPGFSGAVVRAERTGHLVGVVNARAGSHSGSRLNVTPISRLLADEDVPQWIGGSSFEIDELRQREDTICSTRKSRQPTDRDLSSGRIKSCWFRTFRWWSLSAGRMSCDGCVSGALTRS